MGNSSGKKIEQQLESEFKSIKKYQDSFYGEITVVRQISSNRLFAKIQKTFANKKQKQYLEARFKSKSDVQVPLYKYYAYQVDFCSQIINVILLFEYHNHTLYQQIIDKHKKSSYFEYQHILQIFTKIIRIAIQQRQKGFKQIYSNTIVQFDSPQSIQYLQVFFKNSTNNNSLNNNQILISQQQIERKKLYLSPETWKLFCRKQYNDATIASAEEKSNVFTIGLNFLQILYLRDFHWLYNEDSDTYFDYTKLDSLLEELKTINYQIYLLLKQMTNIKVCQRCSLKRVEQYLKVIWQKTYH